MSKSLLLVSLLVGCVSAACDPFPSDIRICLGYDETVEIPEDARWGERGVAAIEGLCTTDECEDPTPLPVGTIKTFKLILDPEYAQDVENASSLRVESRDPGVIVALSDWPYDSHAVGDRSNGGACEEPATEREISLTVGATAIDSGSTELLVLLDDRVIDSFPIASLDEANSM